MERQDWTTGSVEGEMRTPGGGPQTTAGAGAPMGGRMGEQVSQKMEQVRGTMQETTTKAKEATTQGIDRVVTYFREKDTQEMITDLQQMVRKHPGKSLAAGLLLGVLVGRVMR